ncbi:MAG: pyridoxine 5'-phosphate synthase [Alphaproteobacteria bacterium]|nr:pyridoxine 5'-phosphate synthase [Alphaproteobacteria bacterium]
MASELRLGVNVDHVATIRNARGGGLPDPVRAAKAAAAAGADSIVAHLREDRRHISDDDLIRLLDAIEIPLTLEMAATDEMLGIALRHAPHAVCIVPERREEQTTEGGLDVVSGHNHLKRFVDDLGERGAIVSMFIEPDRAQLDASRSIGAPAVEIHVGAYCDALIDGKEYEADCLLDRIVDAAEYGTKIGLKMHAGHGITFDTVGPVAAIPQIEELNIGHFLIGEAIFDGLHSSIKRMRGLMDKARSNAIDEAIV